MNCDPFIMRQPRSNKTINRTAASVRPHDDAGRWAIGTAYKDGSAILDSLPRKGFKGKVYTALAMYP
jgi:hypothetical protein